MNYDIYEVRSGDTLSKIARRHNSSTDDLANINGIKESNFIYPGQKIKIPRTETTDTDQNFFSEFWIKFIDAAGKPIADLKTRIVTATAEYHFTTDSEGLLPAIRTEHKDDKLQLFVGKMAHGEKKVATLTSSSGVHQRTIWSPKQKVTLPLRPHNGKPDHDPASPILLSSGETQNNRDLDGHPVTNVSSECPDPDNLKLGSNRKFRDYIVGAAKRASLLPQCVASIMNAEAGTLSSVVTKPVYFKGKQVLNRDGSPKMQSKRISTGEWDPQSASSRSSARGLTQFLDGTWISMAASDGSFLNNKAKNDGLIIQDTKNHSLFVYADGSEKPLKERDLLKHVTSRATAGDSNVQKLLDYRFDPECAINTAVDYAQKNASTLEKEGYSLDRLNVTERAKLMHASHNLGAGDVADFVDNSMNEAHAKMLLKAQVGASNAESRATQQNDSYVAAHRNWLSDFVEEKIAPEKFACDPEKYQVVEHYCKL